MGRGDEGSNSEVNVRGTEAVTSIGAAVVDSASATALDTVDGIEMACAGCEEAVTAVLEVSMAMTGP